MPGYEIVIPTYNARHTILATLASLTAQTLVPDRVLVLDDGSTDGTDALLRDHPAITYVQRQHAGLSATQNAALSYVQACYVAFVDADDIWHPRTGEILVSRLSGAHDAAATVSADPFSLDKWSGASAPLPSLPLDWHTVSLADQLKRNHLTKSGTMFSTSALRAVGGYAEHLAECEDLDLSLRLLERQCHISATPWRGVGLRRSPASMSRRPSMLASELSVILPRLAASPTLSRRHTRNRARRAWLRALARAAHDHRDLSEVPRLSDHIAVSITQRLLEIGLTTPLSPLAASAWRLIDRARCPRTQPRPW